MHCLAVASILAELQVPPAAVAAGLLHDTVEDTEITLTDLQRDFGGEITNLVDGVTKLTNLPRVSRDDQHAEASNADIGESSQKESETEESYPEPALLGRNPDMASETLRKTFLAMDDDIRVVLIKLAAREVNTVGRTVGSFYAISTLGSVLGAVLTGFIFITYIGVNNIFFIVGLLLVGLSVSYFSFIRGNFVALALLLPI